MRIAQIVYKVDHLTQAVKAAEKKGYMVEYGQKKNPYNAFIYFPEGPYIELMENTGVPNFIKFFMKVFRQRRLANRFEIWDREREGPLGIGIEVEREKIDLIGEFLKEKKINSFKIPIRRVDVNGKSNVCYSLFPENTRMPFYVTKYFNEKSREHYIHENGTTMVAKVRIVLEEAEYKIVSELFTRFDLWNDLGGELQCGERGFELELKGKKHDRI
ncbi:MAG: hypothetical protein HXK80_00180 [Lachnospiraceae bacterium]|nr:hypothetical protein [Lachnospiraceae bacterium]